MTPEEQAAADAEAARIAAEAAARQTQAPQITDETVILDGLTLAQVREHMGTLTTLQAAETTRQTEAETARQAALTESQRIAEEAATASRTRDEATTALETERAAGNNLRLQIAIEAEARAMNVQLHPNAIADSLRLGDFAAVTFNDQREPQGVKEALTGLLKSKPYIQSAVDAPDLGGHNAGRQTGTAGLTGAAAIIAAQAIASSTHGF